ncbi:Protein of unknown function [Variovorax sp. HW608]|uniref:DUF3016 domain-containing protein n=1 Tax=Variovorax sp. HW608 TaxID=1034889 RepID=UPI00081FCD43|nr:DUF3016 domain-containing protein [Variovorax sp. HW608]SCK60469.1 Protein of unknown function [Variovorax sp. HW608]
MIRPLALSMMLAAGASMASAADLTVVFVNPENYRDAAYSRAFPSDEDRAEVLRDVQQHLQRLADRYLGPGDALSIEVLDIDLAGAFDPLRRGGSEVRILTDITWPRMELRYTLTHDGQVIASGRERISDMDYLVMARRSYGSDRFIYERPMLDNWFTRRIVAAKEHG